MERSGEVPSNFTPKAEELLVLVKQLQDAGTLEPRMDDLVGRLRKLQRAKQALSQELQDGQMRSKELQAELEELNAEKSSLEEICSQKQELLRTLQLRSQETEAEGQRQQALTQERKQHIEELAAKIQEEKLKQRKQRLEFEQLLEELMAKHKTLQQCHSMEKLAAEIHSMAESKERLLSEDRLIQDSLAQIEKQLDSLPQARAALSQERMFLKSQKASTALQLFQQENKSATEHLEAASQRHSELQQKYKRLAAELEVQQFLLVPNSPGMLSSRSHSFGRAGSLKQGAGGSSASMETAA